jgi:hypothetical protein
VAGEWLIAGTLVLQEKATGVSPQIGWVCEGIAAAVKSFPQSMFMIIKGLIDISEISLFS